MKLLNSQDVLEALNAESEQLLNEAKDPKDIGNLMKLRIGLLARHGTILKAKIDAIEKKV